MIASIDEIKNELFDMASDSVVINWYVDMIAKAYICKGQTEDRGLCRNTK